MLISNGTERTSRNVAIVLPAKRPWNATRLQQISSTPNADLSSGCLRILHVVYDKYTQSLNT